VNAPKCPFHHFQQDGHMAMSNPKGRVNYEPNSWGGANGGPRECHQTGFQSFPAHEEGDKLRVRSESFADHYSQARQFYISQTPVEQQHIADALVFELSKVETPNIRSRVVSHLPNVDETLAERVAQGLGLRKMPERIAAAKQPRTDLKASKALSIAMNGPKNFRGRKVGALITDGVDQGILDALRQALESEGAMLEIVAPTVGGVQSSSGAWVAGNQKIGGGPSVLYDAVAILPAANEAEMLAKNPAAREFAADAFTHLKFIAYTDGAKPLLEKAGIAKDLDKGCISVSKPAAVADFISRCRSLRFWDRETAVRG
jgi:catalase